jgi:hypothetical protein
LNPLPTTPNQPSPLATECTGSKAARKQNWTTEVRKVVHGGVRRIIQRLKRILKRTTTLEDSPGQNQTPRCTENSRGKQPPPVSAVFERTESVPAEAHSFVNWASVL